MTPLIQSPSFTHQGLTFLRQPICSYILLRCTSCWSYITDYRLGLCTLESKIRFSREGVLVLCSHWPCILGRMGLFRGIIFQHSMIVFITSRVSMMTTYRRWGCTPPHVDYSRSEKQHGGCCTASRFLSSLRDVAVFGMNRLGNGRQRGNDECVIVARISSCK